MSATATTPIIQQSDERQGNVHVRLAEFGMSDGLELIADPKYPASRAGEGVV